MISMLPLKYGSRILNMFCATRKSLGGTATPVSVIELLSMLQLAWNGILWYASYSWPYFIYNRTKDVLHWALHGYNHAVCDDIHQTWIQWEVKAGNCPRSCSFPVETKPSTIKSNPSSQQEYSSMFHSFCMFVCACTHVSLRIRGAII